MRSFRLNLCVFAPEKGISNKDVSCSAVGLRNLSKKENKLSGLLGSIGGSGSGMGTGIGVGVGTGVGVGVGVGPGGVTAT